MENGVVIQGTARNPLGEMKVHARSDEGARAEWTWCTGEFDATITEQHPDERVAWKSDSGPEHAGVVTFHRIDDNTTRVTAQIDVDPEGFVENVAQIGHPETRVNGDLERFKKFIENTPTETGAGRGDVARPDA